MATSQTEQAGASAPTSTVGSRGRTLSRRPLAACGDLAAWVAAGAVRYDAAAAQQCAAGMAARSCAELLWSGTSPDDPCDRVLSGTVAPGGACGIDEQCAGGWCNTTAQCQGTCVAYRTAGQSCTGTYEECGPGLACVSGACATPAYGAAGQPCTAAYPGCQVGLWCDAGTCRAEVGVGGSCAASADACGGTTVCGSYATGCTACIPIAHLGEACGSCVGLCGPGGRCDAGSGKCVSEALLGEACVGSSDCLIPNWCDPAAGTCAAPLGAGAPCTAWGQCASGLSCDVGVTNTCISDPVCLP